MPLYVALTRWTDQGLRNVKDTVKRTDAVIAAAERMDCQVLDLLWTFGAYDIVSIIEAPTEDVAGTLTLATAMQGNVRTHTMRAYRRDEMERILRGLP
ncbi:MAG TPA: GYD domain-containing protein [bacterium]|nr:GYD domain-containing protein [bacterium]